MLLDRLSLMAVKAASTDKLRDSIRGLRVTQNETVATDGHVLIKVNHSGEDTDNFPAIDGINPGKVPDFKGVTLPTEAVEKAIKALPKKTNLPIIQNVILDENVNGKARLGVTDLDNPQVMSVTPVSDTFPSWDQVFPKGEATFRICLDADLIARIASVFKLENGNQPNGIIFEFHGDDGPAILKPEHGSDRAVALLMPRRIP